MVHVRVGYKIASMKTGMSDGFKACLGAVDYLTQESTSRAERGFNGWSAPPGCSGWSNMSGVDSRIRVNAPTPEPRNGTMDELYVKVDDRVGAWPASIAIIPSLQDFSDDFNK